MPQPMSTPTAAGMIALMVGITEPDGGADAEVHVGHRGDVVEDDRQPGGVLELAARLVLDRHAARPHLERHPAADGLFDVVGFHGVLLCAALRVPLGARPRSPFD